MADADSDDQYWHQVGRDTKQIMEKTKIVSDKVKISITYTKHGAESKRFFLDLMKDGTSVCDYDEMSVDKPTKLVTDAEKKDFALKCLRRLKNSTEAGVYIDKEALVEFEAEHNLEQ